MSLTDISKKFGMTKSTVHFRVKRDLKKGIVWKLKRTKRNEVKTMLSEDTPKGIKDIDILQKALDKSYELIDRAIEPRELEQVASAIVKLIDCKQGIQQGNNNIDNVINIPDRVQKILSE